MTLCVGLTLAPCCDQLFQPTNYFHAIMPPAEVPARYLGKQNAQRARSIENGVPLVCANAGRAECASLSLLRRPRTGSHAARPLPQM